MIYLYGLLKPHAGEMSEGFLDRIDGVSGSVSIAPCGDLLLIHSLHGGEEILPRRRSLLSHARVLEAAMQAGTVLPMRFGMTCQSLDSFATVVKENTERIDAALTRVKAKIEMGVRVEAPEDAALEAALVSTPALSAARDRLATQGRGSHFAKVDFGRALGEVVASRRAAAQKALLAELVPAAVEHVLKAPESDFEPLRAEFLIHEKEISAFSDLLASAVAKLDFAGGVLCEARLVGPGPAFHFTDLSLDPRDAEEAA